MTYIMMIFSLFQILPRRKKKVSDKPFTLIMSFWSQKYSAHKTKTLLCTFFLGRQVKSLNLSVGFLSNLLWQVHYSWA